MGKRGKEEFLKGKCNQAVRRALFSWEEDHVKKCKVKASSAPCIKC